MIDIHSYELARYLPGLLAALNQSEYEITIMPRLAFWVEAISLYAYFYSAIVFRVIPHLRLCYDLVISDRQKANCAFIDINYLNANLTLNRPMLPFPMAPRMYLNKNHGNSGVLQKANHRDVLVAFAGNGSKEYDNKSLSTAFAVINRWQAREIIENNSGLLNESNYFFRFWERGSQDSIEVAGRVHTLDWFRFLTNCHFFLALPGVWMPYCHNLTEAMAAGCIPIIQFPSLLDPPLTPGINCIAFESESDLNDVLVGLKSIDHNAISCMRRNLVDYYSAHCSSEAIIRKLIIAKESGAPLYIANTAHSFRVLTNIIHDESLT